MSYTEHIVIAPASAVDKAQGFACGLALFIVAVLLYVRSQWRNRATASLGQPRSA